MICNTCGAELAREAILCGECGTPVVAENRRMYSSTVVFGDTAVVEPDARRWLPGLAAPSARHRRAAAASDSAGAVMLVISSGDSVVVSGSGLVGRSPTPEPSESIRHLIPIVDPLRAVSKTHLAFGFDDDGFWISDRWSSNGTVLLVPGSSEVHLEPGRRYRAVAGSLISLSSVTVRVDRAFPSSTDLP